MWRRLRGRPAGPWLFGHALAREVPYTGTIRPRVLDLEPGFVRVAMLDRRRVRNHLRSVHAIALMNLGEVTTGLALVTSLPPALRAILVELKMVYTKKARGRLVAECRCTPPSPGSEVDIELTAEIRDAAGDVVARATARWKVGPAPSARVDDAP